jgi:hypothetical protein
MSYKFFKPLAALALVALLAIPSVAVAAGAGPGDAMAPDGVWRELRPGQEHWYAFNYDGDESRILVSMNVEPNDGAVFAVRTPEQVRIWQRSGDLEACGCSSRNERENIDAFWAGEFNLPGTYFVVVRHNRPQGGNSYYSLDVEGDGVWFEPAAEQVRAAPAPVVAKEGAPARMVIGEWMPMATGTEHWFSFLYSGDGSQIYINLDAEPDCGASFSVWTPEQARLFSLGQEVEPVGRGSADEYAAGDLSWSGNFANPGTYYVRVEHCGAAPSNCKLSISGADVVF